MVPLKDLSEVAGGMALIKLVEEGKPRTIRLTYKETGEEVALQDVISELNSVVREDVLTELPATNTLVLATELFSTVLKDWFDQDGQLYLCTSERKRIGLMGTLALTFLLGRYIELKGIRLEVVDDEELASIMEQEASCQT